MRRRAPTLVLSAAVAVLTGVSVSTGMTWSMQERPQDGGRKAPIPGIRRQIDVRPEVFRASPADVELDLKRLAATAVPREVADLIDRLGADDFETRTEATKALRRYQMSNDVLMGVLVRGGIGEEQRVRLLGILEWRIMNRPRGAVGVRMTERGFNQNPRGIEVAAVIPGLPAERVLKVGDIIQRLNGNEAFRNESLILQVQQMRPGERLKVEVLRPTATPADPENPGNLLEGDGSQWYEPIEVEIVLGAHEKLNEIPSRENAETRRRTQAVSRMRGLWGDPQGIDTLDPRSTSEERRPTESGGR